MPPWSILNVTDTVKPESYAVVTKTPVIPIANLPLPVIHDGRTTVTISEEGYQSGLDECSSGVSIWLPKRNLIHPIICVRSLVWYGVRLAAGKSYQCERVTSHLVFPLLMCFQWCGKRMLLL